MINQLAETHRINFFWIILIGLTLLSAFIAEAEKPTNFTVLLVCFTITIKGLFVIDEFMGSRKAIPVIRYAILSFFILMPFLIAISVIFPELLATFTTIK
ncbi:MAG: hypothetical protein OQL19_09575 [Gammaproteobacteria bacterium]|nr:hypothetical protein [Gammaproteobacteria bacterium]